MSPGSTAPHQLAAVTASATAYATRHVAELAAELLEWEKKGVLSGQRMRELAQIVAFAGHDALLVAKVYATRAALEVARAGAPAQLPRPQPLTVEQVRELNADAIFGDDWPTKFWGNVTHLVNAALAAAYTGTAPDQSAQERARQLAGSQHYFGSSSEPDNTAGQSSERDRG